MTGWRITELISTFVEKSGEKSGGKTTTKMKFSGQGNTQRLSKGFMDLMQAYMKLSPCEPVLAHTLRQRDHCKVRSG